jgi:hypothetical protein
MGEIGLAITTRGRKNKLKPAPKHPTSLRGGINTRGREKATLPLPKDLFALAACLSCMLPFLLLSQQKLNLSPSCSCLLRREKEK